MSQATSRGRCPSFKSAWPAWRSVWFCPRPLQAAHHNDGGRLRFDVDACRALAAAHQGNQLFIYNFYHLLGGGKALHHLMAQAALCYRFDEPFGDGVVHIRLQKGHAHLTHGVFYILFGKLALAAQLLNTPPSLKPAIQTPYHAPPFRRARKPVFHSAVRCSNIPQGIDDPQHFICGARHRAVRGIAACVGKRTSLARASSWLMPSRSARDRAAKPIFPPAPAGWPRRA